MKNEPITNNTAPSVEDPGIVGAYDLHTFAGGGFIWDTVLEYRVWYRANGAACECFATYGEALDFSEGNDNAEIVLALVQQVEYFEGNAVDCATLVQPDEPRICEWQVPWLREENHRPSMLEYALRNPVPCVQPNPPQEVTG